MAESIVCARFVTAVAALIRRPRPSWLYQPASPRSIVGKANGLVQLSCSRQKDASRVSATSLRKCPQSAQGVGLPEPVADLSMKVEPSP